MSSVGFFKKIFFSLGLLLGLSSCKETNVESGSLGLTLPQPELKSINPYTQSLEVQGYIRLQGSCDSRLEAIQLSVDQSNWINPPTSPSWSNLTDGNPVATNDPDCRDGKFDIHLTQNDLDQLWGRNALQSQYDRIYLRGHSANADSAIVTLSKQNSTDFFDLTPTKIKIEPILPKTYSLLEQCSAYRVYLENNAGNQDINNPAGISFNIESATDSSPGYTTQTIYKTLEDCQRNLSGSTSLTIPPQSAEWIVFHKTTGTTGEKKNIRVVSSGLQNDNLVVSYISTADSTKEFLKVKNDIRQIMKNTCYQVNIELSELATPWTAKDLSNSTLLMTSNSGLKFYSDASCLNIITEKQASGTIGSVSPVSFYVKYIPTGQETTPFKTVDLNLSAISTTGRGLLPFDFIPAKIKVDLSIKNIATKIKIQGTSYTKSGDCEPYEISSHNPNGTLLPVVKNESIHLSFPTSIMGKFYDRDSCLAETSTADLLAGKASQKIYVMPTTNTSQDTVLQLSPASLSGATKKINIKVPQKVTMQGLFTGDSPDNVYFVCGLSDNEGRTYTAAATTTITAAVSFSSTTVNIYAPTGDPSNSCVINAGKKFGALMIEKDQQTYMGGTFSFSATAADLIGITNLSILYVDDPSTPLPY